MNVYLFIPLGLSGTIFFEKKQWRVVFGGFFGSVLIEAVQYYYALGMCETDDVLANTLGCTIGILLYDWVMKRKNIRQKIPETTPTNG